MKGHEDDEGFGACELQGKAEREEIVHPGEQKAQGDLLHIYK